jgi:hypothetical protein
MSVGRLRGAILSTVRLKRLKAHPLTDMIPAGDWIVVGEAVGDKTAGRVRIEFDR